MSDRTGWLRVRALVSSWFVVLAAVCLVVAGVGGWAVYTVHAAPGTTVDQRQETHWSVNGEFTHSAEVTRENPAFETGTVLRNRSTYFVGASPTLDGQYAARYLGGSGDPVSVTLAAALVIRSTDGETVFWENRTALAEQRAGSVGTGEAATVSFSVNASEVADRRAAIEEALGGSPGEVRTFIAVEVTVNGTVAGQPATLSFTHRLPLSVQGSAYTVGPAETGSEQLTTSETVTVPVSYGPFWSIGGPVLLLVGVAGLGTLGIGRRRDAFALTPDEQELLAFREERAEFDEWVVGMRLPEELRDRPRAEAESLEDLVDFAIDADVGVVEDPETGVLAVVTPEFLAVYEPPPLARGSKSGGDERSPEPVLATEDGDVAVGENGHPSSDSEDSGEPDTEPPEAAESEAAPDAGQAPDE